MDYENTKKRKSGVDLTAGHYGNKVSEQDVMDLKLSYTKAGAGSMSDTTGRMESGRLWRV